MCYIYGGDVLYLNTRLAAIAAQPITIFMIMMSGQLIVYKVRRLIIFINIGPDRHDAI